MSNILLIFNPRARRGDNARREDTLRRLLTDRAQNASTSLNLSWIATRYQGHAMELSKESAGYDGVISVGGDGTFNEVINGLMRIESAHRPWLGVLPAGTGNDFALNNGLPLNDLPAAADAIFAQNLQKIDIGQVTHRDYTRFFGNTLGFGFSGAATQVAHHSRTFLRGLPMYLYIVLKTIFFHRHNNDIQIAIDGQPPADHSISMVNICNGPTEGGGFPVAPDARYDDGLLSYVITRRVSPLQMLRYIPIVLMKKHTTHLDTFTFGTARTFSIDARQPLIVQTDGEVFRPPNNPFHHIDVTLHPHALRVAQPT